GVALDDGFDLQVGRALVGGVGVELRVGRRAIENQRGLRRLLRERGPAGVAKRAAFGAGARDDDQPERHDAEKLPGNSHGGPLLRMGTRSWYYARRWGRGARPIEPPAASRERACKAASGSSCEALPKILDNRQRLFNLRRHADFQRVEILARARQ